MRLILDEDLNRRIVLELRRRGYRDTTSVWDLGLANRSMKDPVWLFILSRYSSPSVLVTYDNKMPTVHRSDLARRGTTLAVVDNDKRKWARAGLSREEFSREVVHRWAHRMAEQEPGSRFR